MCFGGGSSGRTVTYETQDPVTISPPTTTVELDESDVDDSTDSSSEDTADRASLRNDLTTSNIGSSVAGQGLNILGGTTTTKTSTTKKVNQ